MMLVSIFVSMETVCIERCPQHGSIASDCIKFGVFGTTVNVCKRDVCSVCKEGFHCEFSFLHGQIA